MARLDEKRRELSFLWGLVWNRKKVYTIAPLYRKFHLLISSRFALFLHENSFLTMILRKILLFHSIYAAIEDNPRLVSRDGR